MNALFALAQSMNARFVGDENAQFSRLREPALAKKGELAMAADPKFVADIARGEAEFAILPEGVDWENLGLKAAIYVDIARRAMVNASAALENPLRPFWAEAGRIHPSAIIHPTAKIGENVLIGPFVVIGENTSIAQNTQIFENVSIAHNVTIGENALIYPGVRIAPDVQIGNNVTIMYNSAIGAEGFSYLTPNQEAIRDARNAEHSGGLSNLAIERIYSLGSVEIGDAVEIGGNVTIDRGTIENTRIANGTKIDNLVHIGHNVQIGENALICAQCGIAGSAVLGNRCIMAGQTGVSDHITIGDDVIATGQTGLNINVSSGKVMMGTPPVPIDKAFEIYKSTRRLPRLAERVKKLEALLLDKGKK